MGLKKSFSVGELSINTVIKWMCQVFNQGGVKRAAISDSTLQNYHRVL